MFQRLLVPLTLYNWIQGYLKHADENQDGKMTYDEVKRLLQMINIDLNEQHTRCLFKVGDMICVFSVWSQQCQHKP